MMVVQGERTAVVEMEGRDGKLKNGTYRTCDPVSLKRAMEQCGNTDGDGLQAKTTRTSTCTLWVSTTKDRSRAQKVTWIRQW